jgi:hypothetical protein
VVMLVATLRSSVTHWECCMAVTIADARIFFQRCKSYPNASLQGLQGNFFGRADIVSPFVCFLVWRRVEWQRNA